MTLVCHVDQVECFRQGIDAPHSTVKLEVNPADLSPSERDYIACAQQSHFSQGLLFGQIAYAAGIEENYVGFFFAKSKRVTALILVDVIKVGTGEDPKYWIVPPTIEGLKAMAKRNL